MAVSKVDAANQIENQLPQANVANNVNFRNIIINGDMSIAQRSTSETGITGGGYKTLDRFRLGLSSAGTWTMSQATDVPSGQGFSKSLKLDCTTADASLSASDFLQIVQKFEGQNLQYLKKGTSNAEKLTCSFWVKSSKTGDFVCELFDEDNTRHIAKLVTINTADTWEKKILTFDADTSSGDTFDNDANNSLTLVFWLAAGSTYSSGTLQTTWSDNTNANRAAGVFNLADSTDNDFYITGVQLEAGDTASDFEFLPHDVNLQRCLRYFERYDSTINDDSGGVPQGIATVDNGNRAEINLFYTRKRASPTITGSSDVAIGTMANTVPTANSGPHSYVGTGLYGANLFYFVASGISTNSLSGINYVILTSGKYINIDAEL